jgi:methionyl-tRNA synthetase
MYVWFDALVNYISALGWPGEGEWERFWPGVQIAGKDNLRQQAAIWQAMLMSAGLPNSRQIIINGFIMVEGQKMSKSLGNVLTPEEVVEKYGRESTRFLLATLSVQGGDVDISPELLENLYQSELVNGLGNLCSRVAKMAEQVRLGGEGAGERERRAASEPRQVKNEPERAGSELAAVRPELDEQFRAWLDDYKTHKGLELIRQWVTETDGYLSEKKPWQVTEVEEKRAILRVAVETILKIARHLVIYMPETAAKIERHFRGEQIVALEPLFPRQHVN